MTAIELSPEQRDFFHTRGYLVVEGLADAAQVRETRRIYDQLFATRAGRDVGDQFDLAGTDEDAQRPRLPQLMNPAKYAPELEGMPFRRGAYSLAQQLLGEHIQAGDEHAICKPAYEGAETPWHQDEAYWDPAYDYEALSIWMPLQAATLENGCMQFIAGSHRRGIVPHHSIGHDPRVHGLATDDVEPAQAVACPIPAGGGTIHHCRTLHYAGANRSAEPRRAYIMTFRLPPQPRTERREFVWLAQRRTARQDRAARG